MYYRVAVLDGPIVVMLVFACLAVVKHTSRDDRVNFQGTSVPTRDTLKADLSRCKGFIPASLQPSN